MNKILMISECYMRLVNIGQLIKWRKEKNMNVKEALEYKPLLKVKEGEKLKSEYIAEYDENEGVYNCYSTEKHTAFFFDERSGNFHLMPKYNVKTYSSEIEDKRNDVYKLLQDVLKEKQEWVLKDRRTGNGRMQYYSLFNYLRIVVDNRNYDLMFFRMAINKNDKQVECALKSIQFAVTVNESSCDIYPETLQESKNEKENEIPYYYNPDVSFEENDKIVDAFIKFIERNENNIYKSIEK